LKRKLPHLERGEELGPEAFLRNEAWGSRMSLDLKSNVHQIQLKAIKPFARTVYEFGEFCLDVEHLMLSREGVELPLTPKQVETLLALVERSGEIVSKD